MANSRQKPFFCFATEAELEVTESCNIIPVVTYLAFINPENKFLCSDSILRFFAKEFWNFDDFLLQRDIGVGQNLLSQLGSCALSRWIDDDVLVLVLVLVETRATSHRLRCVRHFVSVRIILLFV